MSEVHETLVSSEAIAPAIPWPTEILPTWSAIYGTPAITEPVESSVINSPDDPTGTSSVSPAADLATIEVGGSVLAALSNPTPYWWPDLTGLTQGGFHSTPYTGPPQPITQ